MTAVLLTIYKQWCKVTGKDSPKPFCNLVKSASQGIVQKKGAISGMASQDPNLNMPAYEAQITHHTRYLLCILQLLGSLQKRKKDVYVVCFWHDYPYFVRNTAAMNRNIYFVTAK